MTESWQTGLFFFAEIVLLLSYLPTKILVLRCFAVTADLGFIIAASWVGLGAPGMLPTFLFAAFSFVINGYHIFRLIYMELPHHIPEHLDACYESLFSDFTKREFMKLLSSATLERSCNQPIVLDNTSSPLILLIRGKANVYKNRVLVNTITACHFIAEISYLTGNVAIADVIADGEIEYYKFDLNKLDTLLKSYADIDLRFKQKLLHNIIHKLSEQNKKTSTDIPPLLPD